MRKPIPIYALALPEYTAEQEPDYRAVGTQLDQVIETHFSEKPMAIRGISLADHPGLDEPDGELTEAEARLGGLRDCCLFRFKHPDRKPEALLGVIKILP
jgi:hypothetical protein